MPGRALVQHVLSAAAGLTLAACGRDPTPPANVAAESRLGDTPAPSPVDAEGWRHTRVETYDSRAGWWVSDALGIRLYYETGVDFVVGLWTRPRDADKLLWRREEMYQGRPLEIALRDSAPHQKQLLISSHTDATTNSFAVNTNLCVYLAADQDPDEFLPHALARMDHLVPPEE